MIVMVTLINNGGDLQEREEIVWCWLVLLEKNTDPWQTIDDDDDEEESEEEEVQILLDNHYQHNESDNDFDDGVNDDDDADDLYSCNAS